MNNEDRPAMVADLSFFELLSLFSYGRLQEIT